MRILKILFLVSFCCAVALARGLYGCGESGGEDRTVCEDRDGDGYGTTRSSSCLHRGLDCDDNEADVHPGAPELCDGIDNQCQGDLGYGLVDDDAVCRCSFQGGNVLFSLEHVDSDCPRIDVAALFPPGTNYGPMQLPGFEDLPTTTEIEFGPPIGMIPVRFFSGGDDIRVEGTEPIQVSLPGLGTVTATVTGAFCPARQGEVVAGFAIGISSPVTCEVSMEASGTPVALWGRRACRESSLP
jgi:hypothetical protein